MAKRVRIFGFLVAIAALCFASSAFAGTTTLELVNAPNNPVGPYGMYVNGNTAGTVPLVCDDDTHYINYGEIWIANEQTVQNIINNGVPGVNFPSATVADYEAVAWLVEQMFTPGSIYTDYDLNNAIWQIFDGDPSHGEGALIATAFGTIGTSGAPNYSEVNVYTYAPGTAITNQYSTDIPQEFWGVPEAHTSSLLGVGLLALAALML